MDVIKIGRTKNIEVLREKDYTGLSSSDMLELCSLLDKANSEQLYAIVEHINNKLVNSY